VGSDETYHQPEVKFHLTPFIRIDAMYRRNAKVGSGSTADAIRYELKTGELLSPSGHFQKGIGIPGTLYLFDPGAGGQ